MKKWLALFNIILLSGSIQAQGVTLNCAQEPLLFSKQTLSTDVKSMDVLADHSEISKKDNYLLTGNVSLNTSQYYLAADIINIQKSSKTSTANGNVKFQDDELMFTGNKATVKKRGNTTYTTVEQVNFHYPEAKINGKAQKATNNGTEQVFNSVSYSLCPLGNTDWLMKANQIKLNSKTNKGVAKDVTVEFLGVPIFYLPHHEWVLEGRGSGFLAPSLAAHENNNFQVKIPYYFNIAPDRDLLLTLNHLSKNGSVLEGKYRQLINNKGRFEVEGHYLNNDKDSNSNFYNKNRWLLNSHLDLSLNDKTNLNVATNRVSDTKYFKEISHSNTSDSALYSHVDLSYKDKGLNLTLFAENEQLINDNTEYQYIRSPELSISKSFKGLNDRDINLSLVSTKFSHKNSNNTSNKTGVRTHAQINFSRAITNNVYSLTPSLNISNTDYSMNGSANQNRSIARFSLDSKLFLEREMRLFDRDVIQTLTPRLTYNYAPEKDQGSLPIFDSEAKSESYKGLFSGHKFTGIDRINNANEIVIGFESDFIDEVTGDTYLNLRAAQAFYLDDKVMLTDNTTKNIILVDRDDLSSDRRKHSNSNIFAAINISLDDFTFNNALQYNPETSKLDKRDSAVTYSLSPRKFLTIAHHDDQGKKSVELYGAYPVSNNMHIFAGINRSLTDSITYKETTGIAYESCCWAVRLAHFKKHISASDYDYVTNFELVLKGLSTTDRGLSKRLEENIPHYLASLDD